MFTPTLPSPLKGEVKNSTKTKKLEFSRGLILQDKHGVSITIKPVTFLPGNGVGLEYPLPPGEGGDQYEEGGTREMKIGQKGVHQLKLVRGIYEEVSPSTGRRQSTL